MVLYAALLRLALVGDEIALVDSGLVLALIPRRVRNVWVLKVRPSVLGLPPAPITGAGLGGAVFALHLVVVYIPRGLRNVWVLQVRVSVAVGVLAPGPT